MYTEYFSSGKATAIQKATMSKDTKYYGLMWYLESHERYRYLLGKETIKRSSIPNDAELKEIPATLYAVSSFDKDFDSVKAWTDFFSEAIPNAGYKPNYEHGFFFEYYPESVNGNYELWTPVVKADL